MLVGREREVGELEAAMARARERRGGLWLIGGEPGIGKSRLASEAAHRAHDHGVGVAWGRCWEAGGAPAFWPWREAFAALGLPFPDAGAFSAAEPSEARFALFREVAKDLERAATRQPVLIVLEDVHAADRSTLLVLEFLGAQLRELPVVVIGTYRELEARLRAETADAIARLARSGRVLSLGRLGRDDVATLVREAIAGADDALVAMVHDTTHGNPLFVDEILRDIRVHGRRSGLPLGVREVIRQRLAPLSPSTRGVLDTAAVLGVEVATAVVAHLCPGASLDEALASGVLVTRDDRLRFSHALYREALYFELPQPRRRELHREAARVLGATGASQAELAHHLLEAGPGELVAAIDHAIRAADRAVDTFAYEDAFAMLERVRASIPPDGGDLARCRVMTALGDAKVRSGDAAGKGLCIEAAELARTLANPELEAQAGLAYGGVFLTGGVDPVLVGILEHALAGLPDTDTALRARVMARLAAARQPSPPADRDRDLELGLAAAAIARRVASPRDMMLVFQSVCGVLYNKVDPAIRLPISSELDRLAEQLGDLPRRLQARTRLAIDHLELGDFTTYAQLADDYQRLVDRIGPVAGPWRVPLMRSMLSIVKTRFDEAERLQAEARRLGGDDPRARRAEAFHRIGFWRAAERHAELRAAIPELRGLWLSMPYGSVLADPHVACSLARLGAEDELRGLLRGLSDTAIEEEINARPLVEAAWCTGDATLAARLEPLLVPFGDRWPVYWFDCELVDAPNTRGLAYLAGILGRWDDCERLFARALSIVEAAGHRSMAARMRFELGDLYVRKRHEIERARSLIEDGRDAACSLGLDELVALIDRRHPPAVPPARRAPRTLTLTMTREGEYYAVAGRDGVLRFKTSRGMQYLAMLAQRPDVDVHVLDLVGSTEADRGDAGALIDATSVRAYRDRIEVLREAVEDAEAIGNAERAERARDEMEAIAAELARSTQKGGRARRADSAIDRARSAVQRRIKDAIDRIEEQDAELGAWLRRAVRTGNHCSYRPSG